MVKGTSQGTITDLNGKYTIDVTGEDAVLVFSYVGFLPQEQTVGSQTSIDVVMQVDSKGIDEVVVVGYGTQKRSDVTGAISSIDSEELTALPVTTADEALQGRAAGVTITNNGSPGTAASIRIRGMGTMNSNDPLIVIDGVVANSMLNLNPNDIESIQVLKDASTAAIYGSLGANGVLMITTKKGSSGKVKIDFDSYWGQQWNNNRYDLLNTQQYVQYAEETGDPEDLPAFISDPARTGLAETNWQDEIFRKGFMQNYNIGVSGGNENSTFRISMGYIEKEGIMIGTDYNRYNFSANSDYKLGKFKVGENLTISFSEASPLNSNGGRSLIEHAIKMAPYLPVYNSDNLGGYQGPNTVYDGQDAENPVRIAEINSYTQNRVSILGNLFAEVEIIDGLKFKSVAGLEEIRRDDDQFEPVYNDDNMGATHSLPQANIRKNRANYTSLIFTQSLNYNKTIADKHNLDLLAVMEYATVNRFYSNTSSQNSISSLVENVGNEQPSLGSATDEYKRIGYLARLNYNFDSKYLFAASIRRDASSRFGKDNRWGTFPSVSLGWKISNEAFMENVSLISNLKLRGSWGKAGNDRIGNYKYATTLTNDMNYVIDDQRVSGIAVNTLENKELKWEETTMTNIGLDLGLLEDQFTFAFEYYINKSEDLLMNKLVANSLGTWTQSVAANVGSVETKGFEIQLGYNDYEGDFQWSASLNLGTSKNEVLDLGGNQSINGGNQFENEPITRLEVGKTMFHFYGWQFDGVFTTDAEAEAYLNGGQGSYNDEGEFSVRGGDFRIVDTNGDGVITSADRTKIGDPYPKLTAGLNISANYKGFDLNLFIQGVYGNDIYNTNIYDLEGMPRLFNSGTAVLDRWQQDGDVTDVPRADGNEENIQVSSRFVEDGSYTRLKKITLGYTLPSTLFKDVISKFRIYVSAQNLITLTNYSGLDPEVGFYRPRQNTLGFIGDPAQTGNGYPQTNWNTGIDFGVYPMPKSFIAGIQITF
jgi:TonB-linked SusC/RagA family outer membrane protein